MTEITERERLNRAWKRFVVGRHKSKAKISEFAAWCHLHEFTDAEIMRYAGRGEQEHIRHIFNSPNPETGMADKNPIPNEKCEVNADTEWQDRALNNEFENWRVVIFRFKSVEADRQAAMRCLRDHENRFGKLGIIPTELQHLLFDADESEQRPA